MKKKYIALLLIILFAIPAVSFGHSGKTDANGGHNSDTGYHYHHGYPPHQHENGQCPYEFDDKTGWNSGTNGDYTEKNDNSGSVIEKTEEKKESLLLKALGYLSFWSVIGLAWMFINPLSQGMVCLICNLFNKDIEEKVLYKTSLPISIAFTYWLQTKFGFANMFNHPALVIFFAPTGLFCIAFFFFDIYITFFKQSK